MKHLVLANTPDEYEAEGDFEIRPEWSGRDDPEDTWEVARPTTEKGRMYGVAPGAICICPNKATAEAVRDSLNAFCNLST